MDTYLISLKISKIFIKKERIKNILNGHPWIFSNAISKNEGVNNGELAEIYSLDTFLGIGYYNQNTDIAIRILTKKKEKIDEKFFTKRFSILKKQRETFIKNTNAYRIVFGESDNLPGLIIDKYDQVLVMEIHTLGMFNLLADIVASLKEVFAPSCIYLKSSPHSQKIEGSNIEDKILYGDLPEEITINENGFSFIVNVREGQKTGFFLDQRENRKSILEYSEGRNVLNCFSYTGGFSVYAAKNAKKTTSVDISRSAIEYAKKNFEINGFNQNDHEFIVADVFNYINRIEPDVFDMIILDPPSLSRQKNQVKRAFLAYLKLNSEALKRLKTGGILVSSSCTYYVDEEMFIKILFKSAVNAKCQLKILKSSIQPFDHAYNLHFPEGKYLKFFILLKV